MTASASLPSERQKQEIEKQQLQTLKNTTDMKMTLFSSLLAAFLLLSAFPAHGQNDTVDRYYIDKELVSDFDGSQLIGKQISDYRIEYRKGDRPGLTERCNFILTARHALPEKAHPLLATAEKDTAEIVTWVFADGYVIEKEKVSGFFEKIAPNDIESVKVYKFGPNGYVFLKTKRLKADLEKQYEQFYIIDGQKVTVEELLWTVDNDRIAGITLTENGQDSAGRYIINITTKKE